jgi:pimeloyl-ACP methyl ester carboxylesterase
LRNSQHPGGLSLSHAAPLQAPSLGHFDEYQDVVEAHHRVTLPVLAIGAEKAFGANVAVVMRIAATNVQELVVPNAGHWLMEEAPAATIAAVQDFLAAH